MLEINRLDVYYGYVQALRGLSLKVQKGVLLAIVGANGAGKSTLLETLAGLHRPAGGDIILKGKSIAGKPPEYIVKQGISLVPERREIFHSLSVQDNLLLGAYHRYRSDRKEIIADMEDVLELFPALKGRERDLAGGLSGGLQQMLAIGRGLMARPKLLLLDEPSTGLAPLVVREIMSSLKKLKNAGVTIVLVEQNTQHALRIADHVLVMERGRVTLSGSSREIMSDFRVQQAYLGRNRVEPAMA
ncbi:ABC transporter ATP-binding protein [Desulfallas thermosapovorans]|uniref:Branched-chain amino acid transport system ATP-binding protein n=1 Tax=Desulfallas thermosapovorans DSM 6562 TaxID=1121431 RepID=A0A5S4ZNK9_9FIRM|nr:ABC transporter ATP-binding protein [Desulfallas thermosapovorans]TYO93946.1 branched-chain amino acid transport system ATP-binding protein [Desulfallas thermosapovorans DSM 6562]